MKSRESRKLDHIRYALCVGDGPCASGFSDVHLLHHCLSGICRNEVDLTCLLPGLPALAHPIIINAITGGADAVAKSMNHWPLSPAKRVQPWPLVPNLVRCERGFIEIAIRLSESAIPRGSSLLI